MWETSAASSFPIQKGASILTKEILEYFPVGAKFFQTSYFLGSLALSGGLKLARLSKNHINMISFIHTYPPLLTTDHIFSWKFAKRVFSFLVLVFSKAAKDDGLLDNREMLSKMHHSFYILALSL